MKHIVSIDIGSTFTKGTLLIHKENEVLPGFKILSYRKVPTTTDHLAKGFFDILQSFCKEFNINQEDIEIYYSSSAKGGLNIVAIGIVPDLTLKIARITALSAGAKISASFSYKLSRKAIDSINTINPDIILFTGGTDGGNEEINIHNARMLEKLTIRPVVIYAGNEVISDKIQEILKDFRVIIAQNVLPEIDVMNPDDARSKIREIFLDTIIHGKGLDEISNRIGFMPDPTPFSVFEFVKSLPDSVEQIKKVIADVDLNLDPGIESITGIRSIKEYGLKNLKDNLSYDFKNFCLIDLGGATTDFYSNHKDTISDNNVIYKGLPEPIVKRTVEGDLGMRISSQAVVSTAREYIEKELFSCFKDEKEDSILDEFLAYIDKISKNPGYIVDFSGNNLKNESKENIYNKEVIFDRILASACILNAAIRHAGKYRKVYTSDKQMLVQTGKNLKKVRTIIGSGGYLSFMKDFTLTNFIDFGNVSNKNFEIDEISLLPEKIDYFRDDNYLIPIIANLSEKYPVESALLVLSNLIRV